MDFLDIEKLIEQLRSIGKDTQTCEVKESVGKLPASTVETLSAFSNGVGGTLILGLAEKDNFSLSLRGLMPSLCKMHWQAPAKNSLLLYALILRFTLLRGLKS